jgi:hypothetical protein
VLIERIVVVLVLLFVYPAALVFYLDDLDFIISIEAYF